MKRSPRFLGARKELWPRGLIAAIKRLRQSSLISRDRSTRRLKMFRKHVKRDLSAYCNGELAENESRRISEHLHACQSCRREYEQINQGVRLAGELRKLAAPDEIWNGIEELIAGNNTVAPDSAGRGSSQDGARVNRRRWAGHGVSASGLWL